MSSTSIPRIAIIVSQFNEDITAGLLAGARSELGEQGVTVADKHIFPVPGAFELPLIANRLAKSGHFDGVVCLGCVIKGATAHFDYISKAASHGLMMASLETGIPLTFGILTTYTRDQAIVRSRDDANNKGREAAAACMSALDTLSTIAGISSECPEH